MKYLSKIGLAVLLTVSSGFGQNPPPALPEKPPAKLIDIKTELAALPGSSLQWTKIIVSFSTENKWSDGIAILVQAVLVDQGQYRVVSGGARYVNIPAGKHNAILYISPRATARFGKPVLIEASCLFRDQEMGTETWKDPNASTPPGDWQSLNRYPGVLVNVLSTPWIMIDYEKSPDIVGGN